MNLLMMHYDTTSQVFVFCDLTGRMDERVASDPTIISGQAQIGNSSPTPSGIAQLCNIFRGRQCSWVIRRTATLEIADAIVKRRRKAMRHSRQE
jgi:hypothetical protein